MKKPTKVKKPLSPKMREHLKRMHEAAQLAAAKRRKAKKVTQPKKAKKRREEVVPPMTPIDAPEPAKKRKKAVKADPRQMVLPFDPALDLSDDGSEHVSSPGVDASEVPPDTSHTASDLLTGEELL